MKIVKIINSLDFGGIERVFEIAAKYFIGDKKNLVFLCLGKGGAAATYIEQLGFRVIILDRPTKIPNLKLIVKVYAILKAEKPMVVHTCGAEGNFHGLIAAYLAGIRVRIGEEIGMPSHSPLAKFLFRIVYRLSSGVIAVARAVGDYLIVNNEVPKEKLTIIYNPVDIDKFFQPQGRLNEDFLVLSVCRLHPIKNLKLLISAVSEIYKRDTRIRLWLVGDGPERAALETMVIKEALSDVVTFCGFQNDPSAYYSQASAFVLPSFSEGHPVSMIEAMIAGVPVIATCIGGAKEIINEGENGWLMNPYDEKSLIDRLQFLMLMSEEKRKKIVDTAREFALQSFSPLEYNNRLVSYYNSFIK
jgi:glycosyltransferase involved in cell wall biosynthesis